MHYIVCRILEKRGSGGARIPPSPRDYGGFGTEAIKIFFFIFVSFSAKGFLAHCNLIPVWKLGFQILENTLYCILNN